MGYDAKLNFVTDSFKFVVFEKFLKKNPAESYQLPYRDLNEDAEAIAGYAYPYTNLPADFDFSPYIEQLEKHAATPGTSMPLNKLRRFMWAFMAGYASRMRHMVVDTLDSNGLQNIHLKQMNYHCNYSGDKTPPVLDKNHEYFQQYIYDAATMETYRYLNKIEDYPWQVLVQSEYYSTGFDPLIWEEFIKPIDGHYARLSKMFPGKVSYYESPERAAQSRRLCVKPGRYLTKFYPDMHPDEVRSWAAKATNFYSLKIATTAEEIVEVYQTGPQSCMSKSAEYYAGDGIHPCAAYGDSDIALAYISTGKKVSARALVWLEKKLVGRIYGDYDRLIPLLKAEGFDICNEDDPTEDYHVFDGARIRLIPHKDDGHIVCPYIDGLEYGVEDDGWLRLTTNTITGSKKENNLNFYRVQSDSGLGSIIQKIWVSDLAEYRSSTWVEDYCNHCVLNDEWNRYTGSVRYEINSSGRARSTNLGRHRIDSETWYCSLDGYYYMNSIPYKEHGDYKIPEIVYKDYVARYGLYNTMKVTANG